MRLCSWYWTGVNGGVRSNGGGTLDDGSDRVAALGVYDGGDG